MLGKHTITNFPQADEGAKNDYRPLGFTDQETRTWLENEPDFAKRIVTPLNPKHRGNSTDSEILYSGFFT